MSANVFLKKRRKKCIYYARCKPRLRKSQYFHVNNENDLSKRCE